MEHILARLFESPGQYRNVDPACFRPESHEQRTIESAEKDYKGFRFRGAGWYYHEAYTLLVVPAMAWDDDCSGAIGPDLAGAAERGTPLAPGKAPDGAPQLWHFYAYPPSKRANHAMDALKYIANLPEHGDAPRRPEPEPDKESTEPGWIEVHVPAGQRLRVSLLDGDGHFDITYDWKGDNRLVVYASLPGNVMGGEGPIYVEDFDPNEGPLRAAVPMELMGEIAPKHRPSLPPAPLGQTPAEQRASEADRSLQLRDDIVNALHSIKHVRPAPTFDQVCAALGDLLAQESRKMPAHREVQAALDGMEGRLVRAWRGSGVTTYALRDALLNAEVATTAKPAKRGKPSAGSRRGGK